MNSSDVVSTTKFKNVPLKMVREMKSSQPGPPIEGPLPETLSWKDMQFLCQRLHQLPDMHPATHCSSHAGSVASNRAAPHVCVGFTGKTCSTCDLGFINYPTCTECTTDTYCNSHAVFASSNGNNTVCTCSCSIGFAGTTCSQCDDDYFMYPICQQVVEPPRQPRTATSFLEGRSCPDDARRFRPDLPSYSQRPTCGFL